MKAISRLMQEPSQLRTRTDLNFSDGTTKTSDRIYAEMRQQNGTAIKILDRRMRQKLERSCLRPAGRKNPRATIPSLPKRSFRFRVIFFAVRSDGQTRTESEPRDFARTVGGRKPSFTFSGAIQFNRDRTERPNQGPFDGSARTKLSK